MTAFRTTLTRADVEGQARAGPRRPQRADGERRGHRRDPHRARRCRPSPSSPTRAARSSCSSHFGRPEGRATRSSRCSRSRSRCREHLGPPGRLRRGLHRRAGGRSAVAALKPGDIAAAREHPLPRRRGEERSRPSPRRLADARRPLRQRRLLGRAPRPRLDRGPRPPAAGLCRPRRWRPSSRRWRRRLEQSGAAGRGGRRRRQGLDQARPARAISSPRSTHSIIGGGMANTFLAAQRRRCRQVAGRAGPRRRRRARSSTRRDEAELRDPSCRSTSSSPSEFKAECAEHRTYDVDAIPPTR